MSVASVPPGGARALPPSRPAPVQTKPAQSFAELLGQLERPMTAEDDTLSTGLVEALATKNVYFNLAASIAQGAVRFDARPVVGSTSAGLGDPAQEKAKTSAQAADLAPASVGQVMPEIGIETARALIQDLAVHLSAQSRGIATTAQRSVTHVPVGSGSAMTVPSAAVRTVTTRAAAAVAAAPPAARPAPAQQSTGLFARMAMGAQEIQLVIHGAQLSAADLAALTEELRGLLAGTRFADRPVRIITSGRRV